MHHRKIFFGQRIHWEPCATLKAPKITKNLVQTPESKEISGFILCILRKRKTKRGRSLSSLFRTYFDVQTIYDGNDALNAGNVGIDNVCVNDQETMQLRMHDVVRDEVTE